MRPVPVIAFLIVLLSCAGEAETESPPRASPFDAAVRVTCLDKHGVRAGSGTVIGDGTKVATAWHVVKGSLSVSIIDAKGRRDDAVSWSRVGGDYAVIILKRGMPYRGVRVRRHRPTVTSAAMGVAYWGVGQKNGKQVIFWTHIYPGEEVAPVMSAKHGGRVLLVGLCPAPGMSGSGLFVNNELVAVCFASPVGGLGRGYGYWTYVR